MFSEESTTDAKKGDEEFYVNGLVLSGAFYYLHSGMDYFAGGGSLSYFWVDFDPETNTGSGFRIGLGINYFSLSGETEYGQVSYEGIIPQPEAAYEIFDWNPATEVLLKYTFTLLYSNGIGVEFWFTLFF